MENNLDTATAQLIFEKALELTKASITARAQNPQNMIKKVFIDLSVECPRESAKRFSIPFKSFFVAEGTDAFVQAFMLPGDDSSAQDEVPLKLNASWNVDFAVPKFSLYWPAQPGKSLTLYLFLDSKYESGSQVSVTSGGFSLSDGSSFTVSNIAPAAATPTKILNQSNARKSGVITNKSLTDSLFLGPTNAVSNAGATRGFELLPGASLVWRNSAEVWGYTVAAGDVKAIEEV